MKIHVVSFQVPYPANYGGVIDVLYKLKALHDEGFSITLHTFVYADRSQQPYLEQLCDKVHYYQREVGWKKQFSTLPYIVSTRNHPQLLEDLCEDDAPILFDGIHTCYFLTHPRLKDRKKIVRAHNIEQDYYFQLAKQARWNWRSLYYLIEGQRLKWFEKNLRHATLICAITKADKQSLEKRLKDKEIIHLPCFFDDNFPDKPMPTEPFVLYQGNMSVEENQRVGQYIVQEIAPCCPNILFVIAGRNASFKNVPRNVQVIANPTDEHLDLLLRTAHVHLMLTFQPTGIKLKLLNALVRGSGHVVANHDMLYGHSLGRFCLRADSTEEITAGIKKLIEQPIDPDFLEYRKKVIKKLKKAGISRLSLFK